MSKAIPKTNVATEGTFPQPKRALLPEAIADALAEAVATRHLSPGERIVETTLSRLYQVSRVPVREALKILHTQGILTGGGHRGYRVATFTPEKINQIFEIRLMLEAILLRDAVKNWRKASSDLAELTDIIEAMKKAARAGEFREILQNDLEFHRTIAEASGNEIAASLWTTIARHVLIIFNLARYRDIDLWIVVRRHETLVSFIRQQINNPSSDEELRMALEEHFLPRRQHAANVAGESNEFSAEPSGKS